MASLELEGSNLGEKHRTYNKLLKESLINIPGSIEQSNGDIENLVNIDIACHKRDTEYVLNTFKSQDILYVIRALKKSTWLITDSKYAYIMNVTYLQNELFPQMTTKAKTKLLKHIKLHLKDEPRVEEFYNYEANLKVAMKWLPNCSVSFIENNIHKHFDHMEQGILKRLCEKSFTIFEKILSNKSYYRIENLFEATFFLVRTHPQRYVELIFKLDASMGSARIRQMLSAKKTELLMRMIPNQIIENFIKCSGFIHIPTFLQYIKRENIQKFLLEQVNKTVITKRECRYYIEFYHLFNYDTIKLFIKRMPKDEQFDFVKEIFIEDSFANVSESSLEPTSELFAKIQLQKEIRQQEKYIWYEFAPFELAFQKLKMLMNESDLDVRYSILQVLIKCLDRGQNLNDIKILLKYFNDKHANDPIDKKYDFIINLMSSVDVLKYDEQAWNILDLIFTNMDVYAPIKDKDHQALNACIENIIIYKVTRGEGVPDEVEEKFAFTTFKSLVNKLGNKEKENIYTFLFTHLTKEIEKKTITTEKEFETVVELLKNMLNLVKDWNKELSDYPNVCDKIKELIKIKESNTWKANLLFLYNIKKSWRKLFFEDSVMLNPCEEVCMNALKHDPQLLTRYNADIDKLRSNKSLSLHRVNRKLRIYWPNTLASDWSQAYLNHINTVDSHPAMVRGLCTILPVEQLNDIVKKYMPKDAKINWSETNESELSMQRNIALYMHLSRPHLNPDMVIGYAKGDYLKYALPSLIAIFYNLNIPQSREHVPKLLNAPVSLQKHGIRFAFMKLKTEEIKEICSNIWNNSKNATIRKVLFEFTHKLLCNDKNSANPAIIWELLRMFIDSLTYEEDQSMYKLLPEIDKVPTVVKGEYLVKAYKFLVRLNQNTKKDNETYKRYLDKIISKTRNLLELLPEDFAEDMIRELLIENFYKLKTKYSLQSRHYGVITILSAYVVSSKDLEQQFKRHEKVLLPTIKKSLSMWDDPDKSFIRTHMEELLHCLCDDLKNIVFAKKTVIPHNIFVDIQRELKDTLPLPSNYSLLTKCNLAVSFTKLMYTHPRECDDWDTYCSSLIPLYGAACLEYLKQDVNCHFPRIYIPFKRVLRSVHDWFFNYKDIFEVYKCLLKDPDFIPAYLVGIDLLQSHDDDSENTSELRKLFLEHPSVEVKMHFHSTWNKNPLMPGY